MAIDLDLDTDFSFTQAQLPLDVALYSNASRPSQPSFEKAILSARPSLKFSRSASPIAPMPCAQKTQKVFMNHIKDNGKGGGANIEGRLEWEWGNKEGFSYETSIHGKAYDNNGNYLEGSIGRSSDGKGHGTISAGHKREWKD